MGITSILFQQIQRLSLSIIVLIEVLCCLKKTPSAFISTLQASDPPQQFYIKKTAVLYYKGTKMKEKIWWVFYPKMTYTNPQSLTVSIGLSKMVLGEHVSYEHNQMPVSKSKLFWYFDPTVVW